MSLDQKYILILCLFHSLKIESLSLMTLYFNLFAQSPQTEPPNSVFRTAAQCQPSLEGGTPNIGEARQTAENSTGGAQIPK